MMTKEEIRAEVKRQWRMIVTQSLEEIFEARTEFYFKLQGQPAESAGEAKESLDGDWGFPETANDGGGSGFYELRDGDCWFFWNDGDRQKYPPIIASDVYAAARSGTLVRTTKRRDIEARLGHKIGEAPKAAETPIDDFVPCGKLLPVAAPKPAESPVEDGEYQYSAGGSLGDTHIRSDGQWRVRRSDGSFRNTVWGDGALDAEVREGALKKIAPVRPAKTRGEEAAEKFVNSHYRNLITFHGHNSGYILHLGTLARADNAAKWLRSSIAALIDAERADAERQGAKKEREACLEIIDGVKPSSPGGDYSTGINRAVSDIHNAICARGEGQ